ncbi:MAG: hypothetical protein ACI9Y7_002044 [Dokdonia sp.]|jgi:hypothetical protein
MNRKIIHKNKRESLFNRSSYLTGLGSVMNVFGNYYEFNGSKTSKEADYKALYSDWKAIGDDITKATKKISKELIHK